MTTRPSRRWGTSGLSSPVAAERGRGNRSYLGLFILAGARSAGKYRARIRLRGRQITLGSYWTRREAQAVIGSPIFDRSKGRARVEHFAEQWWSSRAGHRVSTRARDRLVLDHDLLPFFGRMALGDISPTDVQAWIAQLLARPLSPSSVRRVFTILDQLLDSAVDTGLIAVNPAARVRLPRISRVEMRFLTPVELELLADTITERYRSMVLTMAWATLRIGEAMGLRRSDLDLAAGTLRVANNLVEVGGQLHEGPPKTAAGQRTMRLPPSLVTELVDHLDRFAGDTYVFAASSGGSLHAQDWRKLHWHPAVEAAQLSPLRAHDLKHTGVAFLAAAGVDPSEIARRAGHGSVAFTYADMAISYLRSTSRPVQSWSYCVRRLVSRDGPGTSLASTRLLNRTRPTVARPVLVEHSVRHSPRR